MSGPPNCTKVLIVITDGMSGDSVSGPATALKNMNVEIYSVGVGSANLNELREMASDNKTEHTFLLNGFSDLSGLVDRISGVACPGEYTYQDGKACPLNFGFAIISLLKSEFHLRNI